MLTAVSMMAAGVMAAPAAPTPSGALILSGGDLSSAARTLNTVRGPMRLAPLASAQPDVSTAPLIPVGGTYNSPGVRHTNAIHAANWAGYAATNATFSGVTGTWQVPTVTCGSADSFTSHWVGIDGFPSDTVEQTGTSVICHDGVPQYSAWYEMYGDDAVNNGASVPLSTRYPVAPGDTMTASVTEVNDQWTLKVSNTTRGWRFSASFVFHAEQVSAEWIVERPDVCTSAATTSCATSSLAASTPATFTSAKAQTGTVMQPAGSFNPIRIVMVDPATGSTLATPSALTDNGSGFTVTTVSTASSAAPAVEKAADCGSAPFTDVEVGDAFCGEIAWLKTSGITTGYRDGSFHPTASISRAAMAAFLYRLTHPGQTAAPTCTAKPFTDVGKTDAFCGQIAWLKTSGITTGYGDGSFHPAASISRAAMAAFLYRLAAFEKA
jgi:hypothetical protein